MDDITSIRNPPPATLWKMVYHDFQNYKFNHIFDFETLSFLSHHSSDFITNMFGDDKLCSQIMR